jgi:hypothetical protein
MPAATGTHASSGGTPRVWSGSKDTVFASTAADETYTDAPRGHKRRARDPRSLDGDQAC